jgi:hypothetical protein
MRGVGDLPKESGIVHFVSTHEVTLAENSALLHIQA